MNQIDKQAVLLIITCIQCIPILLYGFALLHLRWNNLSVSSRLVVIDWMPILIIFQFVLAVLAFLFKNKKWQLAFNFMLVLLFLFTLLFFNSTAYKFNPFWVDNTLLDWEVSYKYYLLIYVFPSNFQGQRWYNVSKLVPIFARLQTHEYERCLRKTKAFWLEGVYFSGIKKLIFFWLRTSGDVQIMVQVWRPVPATTRCFWVVS